MIFIFKFENDEELKVNSLESVLDLIQEKKITKSTLVKKGLRSRWEKVKDVSEINALFNFKKEIEKEIRVKDEKKEITKQDIPKKEEITKSESITKNVEIEKETESIIQEQQTTKVTEGRPPANKLPQEKLQAAAIKPNKETSINRTADEKFNDEEIKNKITKQYAEENTIGLGFFESIKTGYAKIFNFKDRASRSEYWYFHLFVYLIVFANVLFEKSGALSIVFVILSTINWIPALSVSVRRLHDTNESGWYLLIAFIPIIGSVFLLIKVCERGTPNINRFGSNPLKFKTNYLSEHEKEYIAKTFKNIEDLQSNIDAEDIKDKINIPDRAEDPNFKPDQDKIEKIKNKNKNLLIGVACVIGFAILLNFLNKNISDKKATNSTNTYVTSETPKYTSNLCIGNCKNGFGTLTWPKGDEFEGHKYVGEFKNSLYHGQGTYTWPTGDVYTGSWKNGETNGHGIYTSANNEKYVGNWIDNKRNGEGTNTYPRGDEYVGDFKDDKKHGQGRYTWLVGDVYVGSWQYDKQTGYGTYYFNNGDKYMGEFLDGKKHGKGSFIFKNGRSIYGVWQYDKFIN